VFVKNVSTNCKDVKNRTKQKKKGREIQEHPIRLKHVPNSTVGKNRGKHAEHIKHFCDDGNFVRGSGEWGPPKGGNWWVDTRTKL